MWFRWFIALCYCTVGYCLVPKPEHHSIDEQTYAIDRGLELQHDYPKCLILDDAWKRVLNRLLSKHLPADEDYRSNTTIKYVNVVMHSGCNETNQLLWPRHAGNESYTLNTRDNAIFIESEEIWGTLHALETFVQLIRRTSTGSIIIKGQTIRDKPRFGFRGFMIDTSRHFLPLASILQFLDAMSMVKMNVLHWHIVDDQSFPFVSHSFPNLSAKGAFDPAYYVYRRDDVNYILDYARKRGIRVMPEFDTPGHTDSWGKGYKKLLTPCYAGHSPNGNYGPIHPAQDYTYEFLITLFDEISKVFPDKLLHLGGDEVPYGCWASNPEIKEFMEQMQFGQDYSRLQTYYTEQVIDLVKKINENQKAVIPVVWQEVFDQGLRTHKDTLIHVWKENWQSEVKNVTSEGFPVVLSSCWYLNHISYGIDWPEIYDCDPSDFGGTPEEVNLVQGGAACMWGEYVDETNIFSRSWPRGAAVAERLWSIGKLWKGEFAKRLDDVRCQMVYRGWPAESANGPGFCPV